MLVCGALVTESNFYLVTVYLPSVVSDGVQSACLRCLGYRSNFYLVTVYFPSVVSDGVQSACLRCLGYRLNFYLVTVYFPSVVSGGVQSACLRCLDRISLADLSLSFLPFQPVPLDWCNKGCGMYYPVYGMVHIKDPLLSIKMNRPRWRSG